MQLQIRLKPDRPLSMPLAYHHLVQSALYQLSIEEASSYSIYHDSKARNQGRGFGHFCFGRLHGAYKLKDKRIVFLDEVSFEVRSPDRHLLELISMNLNRQGITLAGQKISQVEVTALERTIESEKLMVRMDSPICVYKTEADTKRTTYWGPDDPEFFSYINQNFFRKYRAFYGRDPETSILLDKIEGQKADKYVTKYKGIYITAWGGTYRLCGRKEDLDFLYHTGLGSKNSQGFGLFEIVSSQ